MYYVLCKTILCKRSIMQKPLKYQFTIWCSCKSNRIQREDGISSVSSPLWSLQREDAFKEPTIKVWLSFVRINERFGTAIAIWVFSIRSYSLTKGFIASSHPQNEKRCKNLPMNQSVWRNSWKSPKFIFWANRNLRKKLGTS